MGRVENSIARAGSAPRDSLLGDLPHYSQRRTYCQPAQCHSVSRYGSVMTSPATQQRMRVESLHRYPVKSMLGESVDSLFVDDQGAHGDRAMALIDDETGRVASAKQARLWRDLLKCRAYVDAGRVSIQMPDRTSAVADRDQLDELLSVLVARPVHLIDRRPRGAAIERADPDQVLDRGVDAEVDAPLLELAQATPGSSFVDFAPLHAITTATLEHIGAEAERYRPNLVIATPPGHPPYCENSWVGNALAVGDIRLDVLGPTPRCVVPTLEHGRLPRAPHALRTPAADNLVDSFDFGLLPCAGVYLAVRNEGTLRADDSIHLC